MEQKYKTELCKNWVSKGECQYSSKCRFAHGKEELIERLAQNKGYKTKLCSAFHQEGSCHYAARCHFRHDERTTTDIISSRQYRKKLFQIENDEDLIVLNCQKQSLTSSKRLPFFELLTTDEETASSDNADNSFVSSCSSSFGLRSESPALSPRQSTQIILSEMYGSNCKGVAEKDIINSLNQAQAEIQC